MTNNVTVDFVDENVTVDFTEDNITVNFPGCLPVPDAGAISFTPFGGLSSTNVQDALEELETEKINDASPGGVDTNVQFNNSGAFGGSNDLVWSSDKLGVGESSPSARLHVDSSTEQVRISNGASNYWTDTVSADGGRSIAGFGADADLNIDLTGATDGDFSVNSDDLFVDTSTGHVGIGTSSPQQLLDVNGDMHVDHPLSNGKTVQIHATDGLWSELLPAGFWKGAWMNLNNPSVFERTSVSVSDHYQGGQQAIIEHQSPFAGQSAYVRAMKDPAGHPVADMKAVNPGVFTGSVEINTRSTSKQITMTASPAGISGSSLLFSIGPQGYVFSPDGIKHFPTLEDAVSGGVTSSGVLYQTGSWLRLAVQESFINQASPSLPRFYVLAFNYEKSDGTIDAYTTASTVHNMATMANYSAGSRHYVSINDSGNFILSTTGFTVDAAKVGVIDVDSGGTITSITECFLGDIAHNKRS